jgi:hypothetical protein
MRFILASACFTFFWGSLLFGQGFTDSNLPIVIITTDGDIRDDIRVGASMKIIWRGPGERNYVDDETDSTLLNYDGRINIEFRGSSSQSSDKKQYGFTTLKDDNITNDNVHLLGMPSENDWILNGMVYDPARIRDYLCYNLSRRIGEYASRTAYCEVIINGSYKGLYVLQEKIKADDNRVDVVKILPTDNLQPVLSGGYITKADKTTGGDPVAWTMKTYFDYPVEYIHALPKPEEVSSTQTGYIKSVFASLELQAYNDNVSLRDGFPTIIDIPSFINYMIINELSSNSDAYMFSTFFHKDRNGKLRAGPIWDCDLTFGNDLFFWGLDRSKPDIWQFSNQDNVGSRFWLDLFYNDMFRCYLSKRWNELIQPGQPLNAISLNSFIDSTNANIAEAVARDNALWGTSGTQQQYISDIKSFIGSRISWITDNIGSDAGCTNVSLPSLVISKIMFHPETSVEFPESDEQEFIEITNNGNELVDLSGICFSGTGLVYQFPYASTIPAGTSLFLASNASVFQSRYGSTAFGEFTRHLSNKSQQLCLTDAFGNIIDHVRYYDTIPWPEADGNGLYLKLTSANLDNNEAVSWIASSETFVSSDKINADPPVILYPNPVREVLYIQSEVEINSLSIADLHGRILYSKQLNSKNCETNMGHFLPGTYLIRIITRENTYIQKVVKY